MSRAFSSTCFCSCASPTLSFTWAAPFFTPSPALAAVSLTLSRNPIALPPSIDRSVRASAQQPADRARRSLRGGLLSRVVQRSGQRDHRYRLQDDLPVPLERGEGHALAAEERRLHPGGVELADAVDVVRDALLERDEAAVVDLDLAAVLRRVDVDEVPGAGDEQRTLAVELLQDEPLAAAPPH